MVTDATGPLGGVKVLDLSSYIAGPYSGALLADLGATVIKIEPPEGDNLRRYPSTLHAESRAFLGVNRGKLGAMLDLKSAAGLSAFLRLARHSDVVLHNFRPGVATRLGIGYEMLRPVNPRLIYCALTGYGSKGPLRDKPGYDQVLQAMTGICDLQRDPGQPPAIAYGSVVDFHAGGLLALGIVAALYKREQTGQGQKVELSLLAASLAMQSARFVKAESEPLHINRDMRSGGITGLHPTANGYLYVSANTPEFWRSLCELTGLSDLAENADFATVRQRNAAADELVPRLRKALEARSADEWEAVFGDRVPCAAVRPIEDMFDHPQVLAEDLLGHFDHARAGRYAGIQKPLKFSQTPAPALRPAPALGEHTEFVISQFQEEE